MRDHRFAHRGQLLRRDDGDRGGQSVTAHASDARAKAVEDLQHTLGEGPGVTASESGAAVLVSDLRDKQDPALSDGRPSPGMRWVWAFRAAFAFPLLLGSSRIGALSLYRTEPGDLSSEQLSQGLVTADAVALRLAGNGDGLPANLDHLDPMRVHQAAGMAMVQLGVSIDEALLRMRATAYRTGRASTSSPTRS